MESSNSSQKAGGALGKSPKELTSEQVKRINELLALFKGDGEIQLVIKNDSLIEINLLKIEKYEA